MVRRKSTSGASATGPVSRRATSACNLGAESPSRRTARPASARKTSPPCPHWLQGLSQTHHVKYGAPTPPCSALRLLSSPAHSRACPFAVTRATPVYKRKRNQPGINQRAISSPSRGPTTRPLRASPRHPRLSLRRRCMSSCGAETHLLFTGHSAIDASDTSARRAWSER